MRSKKQVYDRDLSRMNAADRRMTKAIAGFRRKQTGGFSLSELSCLVLSGLAGRKGPDSDDAMRIKGQKPKTVKPQAARVNETRDEAIARLEASGDLVKDCQGCKERYADTTRMPWEVFAPHHKASSRCESGQRNHCTCDTCF